MNCRYRNRDKFIIIQNMWPRIYSPICDVLIHLLGKQSSDIIGVIRSD